MDLIIDGYNLLHAVGIHAPRRGPQNLEGARHFHVLDSSSSRAQRFQPNPDRYLRVNLLIQ